MFRGKASIFLMNIVKGLEQRKETLDPILRAVFARYKSHEYSSEFIARIPQMIISLPSGLNRLQNQAPDLLAYYDEIFIPAVKAQTEKIQMRALSHWPLDLLNQNRRGEPFSLEKAGI